MALTLVVLGIDIAPFWIFSIAQKDDRWLRETVILSIINLTPHKKVSVISSDSINLVLLSKMAF